MMHVKVVKGKIGVAMNGIHKGWGRGATQSVPVGSVYAAPLLERLNALLGQGPSLVENSASL
jgi:hypothetical protein